MKRFLKFLVLTIVVLFILAQFYPRPEKNIQQANNPADIALTTTVPEEVQGILKRSCYDCHSNYTAYPWYSSMQPLASWLGDHITEGKKELNFSEFGTYSLRKKYKKFEEIIKVVEDGEMPLRSYTIVHSKASLDNDKSLALIRWATVVITEMRKSYPADSLIGKK